MFDLERHIQSWRKEAADTLGRGKAERGARAELLDELEAHLRDAFEHEVGRGQPAEEAWAEAVRQLGSARQIAGELAKTRRRIWVPAWVATAALAIVIGMVCWWAARGFGRGNARPLLAIHVILITVGYAAVFATGFLGICAVITRAMMGWTDRPDEALRRAGFRLSIVAGVATLAGVALGAWWARDNMGRWWAWDPKEIGGLCVLAWAGVLLQCFGLRQSTPQTRMFGALIGNIVAALAWFGPHLLGVGLQAYGYEQSAPRMMLGGFLMAQIFLVYLVLLPAGALRFGRSGDGQAV